MRKRVFSDIFYNVLPHLGSVSQFRLVSLKKDVWHKLKLSEERKVEISEILKSKYRFLFLRTLCIQSNMLPDIHHYLKGYVNDNHMYYHINYYMEFFLGQIGYHYNVKSNSYIRGAASGGIFSDPKTFDCRIDILSFAAFYGHTNLCKRILLTNESYPHPNAYYTLGKSLICAALGNHLDICELFYSILGMTPSAYYYLYPLRIHLDNSCFEKFFNSLKCQDPNYIVDRIIACNRDLDCLRHFLKY